MSDKHTQLQEAREAYEQALQGYQEPLTYDQAEDLSYRLDSLMRRIHRLEVQILMDETPERFTYEVRDGRWVVHRWGIYGPDSVLAGQPCKQFVDAFEAEEAVHEEYPQAEPSHPWLQPQVSVAHLPDEEM